MREKRTWVQMKSDNPKAIYIMENGEFCDKFKREFNFSSGEISREERDFFIQEEKIIGWKQIGFNGCWSCDNMLACKKAIASWS